MRTGIKVGLLLLGLATTGCGTKQGWPIAIFAAAATIQTVQAVDAYCSQEDVECTKGQGARQQFYETHDDPYSTAVDWSE